MSLIPISGQNLVYGSGDAAHNIEVDEKDFL